MLKRITLLLLSFLLFLNSSLFIMIYQVKLLGVEYDIRNRISLLDEESSDTYLIKLSNKELSDPREVVFLEEDEIIYRDNLYDIAFTKVSGDSTFYFCLQDRREDELRRALITHFSNTEKQDEKMQYFNILFTFLSNVLVPDLGYDFPPESQLAAITESSATLCRLIMDIPPPPPKYSV